MLDMVLKKIKRLSTGVVVILSVVITAAGCITKVEVTEKIRDLKFTVLEKAELPNELKEKIQDDLGVPCPIATFHSTGNAIIHKNSPEEKLNIVDNSKLYFVIRDYFRGSVMKNESVVNKLIMFFATYFDAPYEGDDLNGFFNNIAKANYSTMRSDLEDFKREVIDTRTKKSVTIQNEILRSHQEVEIANFLYLNNIEYEYEPIYQYNILNNVVDTVLRALQDVSKVRYYGVTMLTDILRGANSKRILDNGLEMVPEYGMLKEIPRETIQNIIEWLINEHYILKTKEKYPVLHSTYEGLHYSESLTKTKLEELKAYLEKDEA